MIEYNIWFSTVNLSHKIKLDLLKKYGTTENIWICCNEGQILDSKLSMHLKNSWDRLKINEIKKIIKENNINLILYNEDLYPQKLKVYEDAPSILFYKGHLNKLNEEYSVSIVGSRNCTSYGINVTKIISTELSKNNVNVISGLAKGIDSCAHVACIDNNGFTCGVIGCGIDIIYPKENKSLYDKIIYSGCIISEFPPGTQPLPQNFPIRNRIISGLSDIVIVVEAGMKSGSLITAGLALQQGKDVMAVPGSIFSNQSKGCNKLINDGAYPVTCIEDIFRLINLKYSKSIKVKPKFSSTLEKKIYCILNENPIHIDDILRSTNIDINHLYEVLFELQLKDEIICLAGNYYVRNKKTI
ncbi:DNA-processing protein DprA [Clostridium sp. SYSU_GA19001]|uniref:DNA-processing protein DprA n=1 Tax=Clostridium caldaquaticum TaxID=2940653 RepID=UPI0020779A43|nr:DNA-processing protein DprA [Clostridium caldaquaticum]MCM8710611.1 DNA-processing protein DprA [Clostridium caldaquaticum]